ncbi:hypothetical protein LUZ60_002570 [Juncus effusus]|nr:hypothetical protein LUZ60_002570 [Juncus effusus]
MGFSKNLLALFLIWIVACSSGAWAEGGGGEAQERESGSDSGLKVELEQLRSKISSLESSIELRNKESKAKDEGISKLEKIIQEKSGQVASLQSEIASLQKKSTEEKAGKINAKTTELEKQIDGLRKEIESQNKKKTELETKAFEAETKAQELSIKLESLQKTSEDQRKRIQKTERALKVAEEELMRLQLEASVKSKQLHEVHGAWLPPWLVTQWTRFMVVMSTEWGEHGKPAMDSFTILAKEKSKQAQKWAEPHFETAKTKLVPIMKEKYVLVKTNMEPYVELLLNKLIKFYEASKSAIKPHLAKIQEISHPYVQEAKRVSKPYIDNLAEVSRPHVEKIRVLSEPYTKKAVGYYAHFLKSASTYHSQAQAGIEEYLHRHEVTKSLATKELVWFLASALLALPVFFLLRLFSELFCVKKAKKKTNTSHAHHGGRKHKRRHADK